MLHPTFLFLNQPFFPPRRCTLVSFPFLLSSYLDPLSSSFSLSPPLSLSLVQTWYSDTPQRPLAGKQRLVTSSPSWFSPPLRHRGAGIKLGDLGIRLGSVLNLHFALRQRFNALMGLKMYQTVVSCSEVKVHVAGQQIRNKSGCLKKKSRGRNPRDYRNKRMVIYH